MEKESLTYKAFKNSSYSIVGHLWPIIFTLLVTPIIIFTLGVKEYGIYLFISTSMGLLGLLEFGLSLAVLKDLSFYFGKKDEGAMIRLIHSANLLFFILGSFYLLVSLSITLIGTSFLPASFSEYEKYSKLFIFSGGAIFFATITSTYNIILQAIQRFDIINKISIASTTLSSLGMLLVVKLGGSLLEIFITQLLITAIFSLIVFYNAKNILPIATFKLRWYKEEIIKCYRFGIVAFINNFASTSLSSLDKLIIPFFAGPSNLTYYSMPGNVATRIPGISGALSVGMLPLTSQFTGSDEILRMKTMYVRTFRLITIIAGALTITTISFSYQVLQYWLSLDFAERSSSVLVILALTNFILALFVPLSSFLLGLGKLKFLTISSVGMALLNVVALVVLLPFFGIKGAAWAYLISVLPIFYLFYYVETRYLDLLNRKKYYIKIISGTIVTSCLVGIINNIFVSHIISNLFTLLIAGGISFILYIVIYKFFGFFEQEDWNDVERFSSLLLKRLSIKK